jgi:hypothetical protein
LTKTPKQKNASEVGAEERRGDHEAVERFCLTPSNTGEEKATPGETSGDIAENKDQDERVSQLSDDHEEALERITPDSTVSDNKEKTKFDFLYKMLEDQKNQIALLAGAFSGAHTHAHAHATTCIDSRYMVNSPTILHIILTCM